MIARNSPLGALLSMLVSLLCGWLILAQHPPAWVAVLAGIAFLALVVTSVAGLWARDHPAAGAVARTAAVVGVLAGSLAAPPTDGTAIVAAAICTVALLAAPAVPLWAGLGVATAGLGLIALSAVASATSLLSLLAMCFGMLLAILGGYSRRQGIRAQQQAAVLAERELQMREEASRVALARDLHDVLAHTLGGLVIQLDAAEALMDAGDTAASRVRVADARALAGAGLDEARRAVAALRAPSAEGDAERDPAAVRVLLDELVAAHRALGGSVAFTESGTQRPVPAAVASALHRALREALSNARRHAAGEPVAVAVDWRDRGVTLTVSNPLPVGAIRAGESAGGGGYGLVGMRERFAALPGGGTVHIDRADGLFVVTAEAGA